MNPSQSAPKAGPTLVRDVTPPAATNAEIVNNIPVKNPLGPDTTKPQPLKSPAAQVFKPSTSNPPTTEDKELDHILKDVNSSVKRSENSIEARFEHLSGVRKKVAVKKAKVEEAHNGKPPIVATVVACLVALMLSAAAFYVYRNGY
ncbi:MAG: hypothetical protein WEC17_02290 [Candidatus Saccharimonadales bacterium]